MDWRNDTISFDYLKELADSDATTIGAIDFLRKNDIIPSDVEWKRGNALPRTSLDREAIPFGYLAEVAFDWDKDGPSSPVEFVDAIGHEVSGTTHNTETASVLADLGRG